VRPRRHGLALLRGPSTSPLDVAPGSSVPPSGPFARTVTVVTRGFGALALFAGLYLLGVTGLLISRGEMDWSRDYRGLLAAAIFMGVGILGLKGPVFRQRSGAPSNNRWRGP
jgi:hypothetical protein